jgi:hypothetical protein
MQFQMLRTATGQQLVGMQQKQQRKLEQTASHGHC